MTETITCPFSWGRTMVKPYDSGIDYLRLGYGNTLYGEEFRMIMKFDLSNLANVAPVSYTHLRAHETPEHLVCRLLLEQKNIPLLIDILEKVVGDNRGINFRFKIVGQGPFLNYFQEQIKLRKVDGFIDFHKSLNRDEIVDLFLRGDFFILCSRFEGFPRVFMESAASALPVVTTRVGGIKGILKDGENSFIIEQGDFSGFVDRVNLLIRDNDLRKKMSEAIKNNFRNNYSFELTIDSQKKIFDYLEAL